MLKGPNRKTSSLDGNLSKQSYGSSTPASATYNIIYKKVEQQSKTNAEVSLEKQEAKQVFLATVIME